ncbi:hypothetical protein HYALB_00005373 [Hymenoscyphus albidus]|uniref:Mannosyltransferase n=1 Tax=Hymenoscyphus albidus TaxID=595503 RepID=A0A9N9LCA9_9HELO|nr:hypothetical protein HYALB_00005373 [Hymenoscyphus albidus]
MTTPTTQSPQTATTTPDPKLDQPEENLHSLVYSQRCKDIWIMLVALRCVNALFVRTFFQPDEYFQSLEPAWQMAFGSDSGAWITWEWDHQLRSSLHPAMFAAIYYAANKTMELVSCFPQFRAMILKVLPNVVQALFAAATDYYTWQFAEKIYGKGSRSAWVTLFMSMFSPWNWFCSTRTFSNCVEMTLTIAALSFWPWEMTTDASSTESSRSAKGKFKSSTTKTQIFTNSGSVTELRTSLLLAFTACILRPTNGLIWFSVVMPIATQFYKPSTRLAFSDYLILIREVILCLSFVLLLSAGSDKLYFGKWTFPPLQWLNFNISQDLAVFYGRNDWHYYLSQGLPLLLTTYLPFTIVALWKTTLLPSSNIRVHILTLILVTIGVLSQIAHKEVRFIYPLLPLLHILTSPTINIFFTTLISKTTFPPPFPSTPITKSVLTIHRKPLLATLFSLNLLIAGYTSFQHQRGVISVLSFLRHEYETLHLDQQGRLLPPPSSPTSTRPPADETFVAFLMPCHSTPWRSHLFYPTLRAWALECPPPIHLSKNSAAREAYRDEADRFYDDPKKFLSQEVGGRNRPWPRYVVGFQGIEAVLREWYEENVKGWGMREKWRGGNSDWIDDSRRVGDVVVWEFVDGSLEG